MESSEDVGFNLGVQVYFLELQKCSYLKKSQIQYLIREWIADADEDDMIGPSFSVAVSSVRKSSELPWNETDFFVEAAIRDYILSLDDDDIDLTRLKALLFDRCTL